MAQQHDANETGQERSLFADRTRLEADIARLLADFTSHHDGIAGLNLSLYRRRGSVTAAEEYGVQVRPCP
jgi:hypothetical protein